MTVQTNIKSCVTEFDVEKSRVLIVDHDPYILNALAQYLSEYEFEIQTTTSTSEMRLILDQEAVDILLLDVRLPGENGLDVCKRLGKPGDPAIIIISEMADDTDRIVGLELGADDYIAKPFCQRELLARIRAVLRPRRRRPDADQRRTVAYEFAGWRLDVPRRELASPHGQHLSLPKSDLALLRAFLDQPMRPLTRQELLDLSHGSCGLRGMNVQVSRLRRKLESGWSGQQLIMTIRRSGYLFNAQVQILTSPLTMLSDRASCFGGSANGNRNSYTSEPFGSAKAGDTAASCSVEKA